MTKMTVQFQVFDENRPLEDVFSLGSISILSDLDVEFIIDRNDAHYQQWRAVRPNAPQFGEVFASSNTGVILAWLRKRLAVDDEEQ